MSIHAFEWHRVNTLMAYSIGMRAKMEGPPFMLPTGIPGWEIPLQLYMVAKFGMRSDGAAIVAGLHEPTDPPCLVLGEHTPHPE